MAVGFAGCEGWHEWDNVFNRDKRGLTQPTGWRSADGDAVIRIPELGSKTSLVDRTLRVYGDTYVYGSSSPYNKFRAGPDFTSNAVPRNTIAVHDAASTQYEPPSASEIKFYATDASTATRKDMTTIGVDASGDSYAKAFALSPTAACANAPATCWVWPGGGGETVVAGSESSTFVFYTEWSVVDACAYDQQKTYVYEITNPEAAPDSWTINAHELVGNDGGSDVSPIAKDIEWGVATLKAPGSAFVYVYGNTLLRGQPCPWTQTGCFGTAPSGDIIERENVVLARVAYNLNTCSGKPCFADYKGSWQFWWDPARYAECPEADKVGT